MSINQKLFEGTPLELLLLKRPLFLIKMMR